MPETERLPGYILYLLAFRALLGPLSLWPVLGQAVIDALTCAVIGRLGAVLARELALAAGLVAAFNLNLIAHSGLVLTDTLFLFFFTIGLLGATRYCISPTGGMSALTFIGFTLALLVRPVMTYFLPLTIIVFAVVGLVHRIGVGRVLGHLGVAVAIITIGIAPILARNIDRFGVAGLSTQGGVHALYWVAPLVKEYGAGIPFAKAQAEMRARLAARAADAPPVARGNPFIRNTFELSVAREAILEAGFPAIVRAWLAGAAINLMTPSVIAVPPVARMDRPRFYATEGNTFLAKAWRFATAAENRLYLAILWSGLLITGMARLLQGHGAIIMARRAPGLVEAFWLFVVAYFLAITGPVAGVKYRLPLEPILCVLFAIALVDLFGRRRWRP
jgi:4-amino-4-deoxy-L-arabinose transferase-like glycosyltransferase